MSPFSKPLRLPFSLFRIQVIFTIWERSVMLNIEKSDSIICHIFLHWGNKNLAYFEKIKSKKNLQFYQWTLNIWVSFHYYAPQIHTQKHKPKRNSFPKSTNFFSLSVLFVCHSNNIFHKLTEMGSPEKSLRFNIFLFTSKTTLKFRERFIKFDEIFQLFWRLLMCGSCHIRSVVIGIEYPNCPLI